MYMTDYDDAMAVYCSIGIAIHLIVGVVVSLEYSRCIYRGEGLFLNYENFSKMLRYKINLTNEDESRQYDCQQEGSELLCKVLTMSEAIEIILGKYVTKYNITLSVENKTVLSFTFIFDECHLFACETFISYPVIQEIQELDNDMFHVLYKMQLGQDPPGLTFFIETTDLSTAIKQNFPLDENFMIEDNCSDQNVCVVASWQACINDAKVNKTLRHCKVTNRMERRPTNLDQCYLYPREKKVQVHFKSSDIAKEFELSVSGNRKKYMTNESSISISLDSDNVNTITVKPCTKCGCSNNHERRCIEDVIIRGKKLNGYWYIAIIAVVILAIAVLILLFYRRLKSVKRTVEVKEKETINPRERGSEYEQITNAVRGYDKIPEHEVVDERDSGLFLG